MINKKTTVLFLPWALAATALVFTNPRPPFTLLDRFSPSHLLLLFTFLSSSLYLLANYKYRVAGFIHLLTIATIFILHPYSELFGRDGTPIIFGIYLLFFIIGTPLLKNEYKLLTVTLFLCFVIVEVWVPKWMERQSTASEELKEWADFVDGYQLHEGGYLLPEVNSAIVGEFGKARFITNNFGFRYTQDISYDKPEGALRLIFIGDSFVAGYRTDQKDTIGSVLQAGLQGTLDTEVEVLIAGVHDTAWAARYVQDYALQFNPDLIIVGVTLGNDISGHYVTVTRQRFSDERIAGSLLPVEAFDVSGLRGAVLRLDRNLSSWETYRLLRRTKRDDPIISWHGDYPLRVHAFDIYHALGYFYTGSEIPIVEESFQVLEETLLQLKAMSDRHNASFMIVLFPQRFQVRPGDWRHTLFSYGLNETAFDVDAPNRRILQFCERNEIACLDVLPKLRQSGNQELFFPLGDMHMSKLGQQLTAGILQQFILRNRFNGKP